MINEKELKEATRKGILSRVLASDESGTVRSNNIKGKFVDINTGEGFRFFAEPFNEELKDTEGAFRLIYTSDVISVKTKGDTVTFKTLNSTYQIELLQSN